MFDSRDVFHERIPDVKRDLPVINTGVSFAFQAPYDPRLMSIYDRDIMSEGKCYTGTVRSSGNDRQHSRNSSCCLYKNNPYTR